MLGGLNSVFGWPWVRRNEFDDRCLRTKHVREGRTHTTVLNRVRLPQARSVFICLRNQRRCYGVAHTKRGLLRKERWKRLQEYRAKLWTDTLDERSFAMVPSED